MFAEADELCGVEAVRADWIDGLIGNLQRRIALRQLYLFGSRASGEHLTWSDYDVCLISDDFQGLHPWERMELVLGCWPGDRPLEPVCFTRQEFERGVFVLIEEIRRKGILLYPSSQESAY